MASYRPEEVKVGFLVVLSSAVLLVFLVKAKALPDWFAERVRAETVIETLGGVTIPSSLKYAGGIEIGKVVRAVPEGEKVRV